MKYDNVTTSFSDCYRLNLENQCEIRVHSGKNMPMGGELFYCA